MISAITNLDTANKNQAAAAQASAPSYSGFSSYLSETTSLDGIFQKAADTYQISANLIKAVAKAESEFNPNAVSRCGAQGVMQLMPATAASLGVKDSFDPEQNIMGGAKYLSQLLDKYEGNVSYALAAYNAGSGNVAKYGGIPPFKETQNYVKKISEYLKDEIEAPATPINASASPEKIEQPEINYNTISSALEMFDYEDYLFFIKLYQQFMQSENEEKQTEKEQEKQQVSENSSPLNNIPYTASALNFFDILNS